MRQPDFIGIIIAAVLIAAAIIALGWMTFAVIQHQALRGADGKADLLRPEILREGGQ